MMNIYIIIFATYVFYRLNIYKHLTLSTGLFIIIGIYIFYRTEREEFGVSNPISHHLSNKIIEASGEVNTLKFNLKGKKSIYDVDLLVDPNYSIQKDDLVIDENDDKYYREHIGDFMMESSKYNGFNSNRENVEVVPIDGMFDNHAAFDKNEQGYFGSKMQNVHASDIQKNVKEKYNKIEKVNVSKHIIYKNEIVKYVKGNNVEKLRDILSQIEERNSPISKLNDTEVNILNNTWASATENVKTQLVNELLDMTDGKSYIVCPSGVSSRIINSNIVNDPDHGPSTEGDLHEEMMNTASNVRKKLEESREFTLLDEDIQTGILKNKLIDKFYDDYNGVIPMEKVQKELDLWIDYV